MKHHAQRASLRVEEFVSVEQAHPQVVAHWASPIRLVRYPTARKAAPHVVVRNHLTAVEELVLDIAGKSKRWRR